MGIWCAKRSRYVVVHIHVFSCKHLTTEKVRSLTLFPFSVPVGITSTSRSRREGDRVLPVAAQNSCTGPG